MTMAGDSTVDRDASLETALAYLKIIETPDGAVLIADLDRVFGGNPFDATNPHGTSYRCGQLSVVAHILGQIERARDWQAGQRQGQGKRQETAQL